MWPTYKSPYKNLMAFHCNFYEGSLGDATQQLLQEPYINFIVCNKMQSSWIQMRPNDITSWEMLGTLNESLLKCLQHSSSSNSLVLPGIIFLFNDFERKNLKSVVPVCSICINPLQFLVKVSHDFKKGNKTVKLLLCDWKSMINYVNREGWNIRVVAQSLLFIFRLWY